MYEFGFQLWIILVFQSPLRMPSGNIPEPNDGVVACGNQNDIPGRHPPAEKNDEPKWGGKLESFS